MEKHKKEWNLAAGKTLKKFRLERNVSRIELGRRLSCTSQAISQFEINGIGTMETIVKVCLALDVNTKDFLGAMGVKTKKESLKRADVITPEMLKTFIKCPCCGNITMVQVFIAPFVDA